GSSVSVTAGDEDADHEQTRTKHDLLLLMLNIQHYWQRPRRRAAPGALATINHGIGRGRGRGRGSGQEPEEPASMRTARERNSASFDDSAASSTLLSSTCKNVSARSSPTALPPSGPRRTSDGWGVSGPPCSFAPGAGQAVWGPGGRCRRSP